RRHTSFSRDWSSDVCSSDLKGGAVITLAAHLPVNGSRIVGPRVALGSMAPTPIRARAAERALEGRPLDASTIGAAAAAAVEGTGSEERRVGKGARAPWPHDD